MNHYQRGLILRLFLAIFGFVLAWASYFLLPRIMTGPLHFSIPSTNSSSTDYSSPSWSNDYDNDWDSGWSLDSGDSGWSSSDSDWDYGGDSGSWDNGGGDSGSW